MFMHIFTIFCAYLCICCAYLRIFMHVFISFMHIYAYCCTRHPYLCIFYVYLCIFKHIYECVCIFDAYLYTSAFFMHIYTYSHISIHEKTLIRCQWKIMQPGYTPQGVAISASTLNIHLSISITGSIDIHSKAEPEWPHGTVAGSALCAYIYVHVNNVILIYTHLQKTKNTCLQITPF